jgi:orotidine-5'-phosphate decarboxylase
VGSAVKMGAEFLTVHTAGGAEMLRRAVEAAGSTKILGVTVLTSLDEQDLKADGVEGGVEAAVVRRARLAASAGVPGLVCSPREVSGVRQALPQIKLVVPGVRPAGAALGDQKRVATPASAIASGADYLVVGRPIRDDASPAQAFTAIVAEVDQALKAKG